jgi:hypothetical protein
MEDGDLSFGRGEQLAYSTDGRVEMSGLNFQSGDQRSWAPLPDLNYPSTIGRPALGDSGLVVPTERGSLEGRKQTRGRGFEGGKFGRGERLAYSTDGGVEMSGLNFQSGDQRSWAPLPRLELEETEGRTRRFSFAEATENKSAALESVEVSRSIDFASGNQLLARVLRRRSICSR